ncbi:MAG TPA: efflux RND transporter periplasmic adaptor subunit [Candidatus Hydrogenedentes bacterium]|nr:efflux RND transporter periplasmic adaptor subunit [Candidatus Hydrogenedentota bacterium]
MTNDSHEQGGAAQPRRPNRLLGVAQAVFVLVLLGAGWFLRGLMPSGPAGGPAGMPAGAMGGPQGPPAVVVAAVTEGPAEAPEEFIGRVESIESVDVTPQIAGYLQTVHFEEGSRIAAGDLLFTIEKAPFEARVALAEAAVHQAEANVPAAQADLDAARANLVRAEKYYDRLKNADQRSVVQADLDKAAADFQQAQAHVKQATAAVQQAGAGLEQAQASLRLARIDLGYTDILAPISGPIGKALVTEGNYVTPASGPLARIVQIDPVRVVYSVPDRNFVNLLQVINERGPSAVELRLRLPNGTLYEDEGEWSFADNEMDPTTGTIALRARFANPAGLLVPMTNVTVLARSAEGRTAPKVPSQAVMADQQGEFVYVVTAENIAEQRRVVLGAEVEGHRIVEDGLASGEQVVVLGLQKVQPGQPVQPTVQSAGAEGN